MGIFRIIRQNADFFPEKIRIFYDKMQIFFDKMQFPPPTKYGFFQTEYGYFLDHLTVWYGSEQEYAITDVTASTALV